MKIVQHRGCEIDYEVFHGTVIECKAEIKRLAKVPNEPEVGNYYVTNEIEEINGDNQPFHYSIEVD